MVALSASRTEKVRGHPPADLNRIRKKNTDKHRTTLEGARKSRSGCSRHTITTINNNKAKPNNRAIFKYAKEIDDGFPFGTIFGL